MRTELLLPVWSASAAAATGRLPVPQLQPFQASDLFFFTCNTQLAPAVQKGMTQDALPGSLWCGSSRPLLAGPGAVLARLRVAHAARRGSWPGSTSSFIDDGRGPGDADLIRLQMHYPCGRGS